MSQINVKISRKEGAVLEARMPEEKLDIRMVDQWLWVNQKTGELESVAQPNGQVIKIEKSRTLFVVPAWNVLDVSTSLQAFTTATAPTTPTPPAKPS